MAWLSTLKGNGKAKGMIVYYALIICAYLCLIYNDNAMPWHGLIINLCFYTEIMLNQTAYIWKIYLVYEFLENAKTCIYGNKADCMFKNKPIHCYAIAQRWKSIEHWIAIHLSSSVIKWYTSTHKKGFWNSWFRRFSEVMDKIGEEY